jgi:hypothetical protein
MNFKLRIFVKVINVRVGPKKLGKDIYPVADETFRMWIGPSKLGFGKCSLSSESVLTESPYGLPQSLSANVGVVPQIGLRFFA